MSSPEFTQAWFRSRRQWGRVLRRKRTRIEPLRRVLEIGVFEGRFAHWMLTNHLSDADCEYVGIDPWDMSIFRKRVRNRAKSIEQRARDNLSGFAARVTLLKGKSVPVLWQNHAALREPFDLIHVDGNHDYPAVLMDTVLVWPLLRVGGVCGWDDWRLEKTGVKRAVADFLDTIPKQYTVLSNRGGELIVRKEPAPCRTRQP